MMRWKKSEMDNCIKLADKGAELQLRGRRVDNCYRLHVTLVSYGAIVSDV